MIEQRIEITNKSGLHVRPAGIFAKEAAKFDCDILIRYDGKELNAKSVLNVLSSGAKCGSEITLVCDGADEEKAMEKMTEAVRSGLGE